MVAANPFVPAGCVERRDPAHRRRRASIRWRRGWSRSIPQPNVPGAGFFNNNFISNGILEQRHQPVRRARRPQRRRGPRQPASSRYSFQQTDRVEPPLLERSGGLGRLRQQLPDPRPERRRPAGRASSAASVFSEFRAGYNRVRSDAVHPAFGIDSNARVRHHRRAQRPALLRRAAAHADRALRAPRRAVLPAAVPDLAGVPVRREPHLDQGHATR